MICRHTPTRAREYAGDAPSEGDGAHAVRLGRAPGRRVGGAGADDRVDECLGVGPEAASLLQAKGTKRSPSRASRTSPP